MYSRYMFIVLISKKLYVTLFDVCGNSRATGKHAFHYCLKKLYVTLLDVYGNSRATEKHAFHHCL